MNSAGKLLVLLLRALGILLLLALPAVIMPFSCMKEVHRWLGMGELPQTPIVDYLARSLSALYAAHGFLLLFLARDLHRYLPLVKLLLWVALVFGAGMLAVGIHAGMPRSWIVCEGPFVVALSLAMLGLSRRVQAG